MTKKLLAAAMAVVIIICFAAYAWTTFEGARAEENKEAPSDVTEFKLIVNGIEEVDVHVCVDTDDGLTEEEAELIAGTTFIMVMGEYVTHRLDTLTFNDTEMEAHYTWGYDENDIGHVFYMTADLTALQIAVNHCF